MKTKAPPKRFYDKKLSVIQNNAKRLIRHPVFSNIEHIQDQLNDLKASHRQFVFTLLAEHYGEEKARLLSQHETIKAKIDNFENLDSRVLKLLDKESKKIKETKNRLSKLKHSYYYKEKCVKDLKHELLERLSDEFPDLIHPPNKAS